MSGSLSSAKIMTPQFIYLDQLSGSRHGAGFPLRELGRKGPWCIKTPANGGFWCGMGRAIRGVENKTMTLDQIQNLYRIARSNEREALSVGATGSATTYHDEAETLRRMYRTQSRKNRARRERDDVMRSCGLVRVVGALGGIYWE